MKRIAIYVISHFIFISIIIAQIPQLTLQTGHADEILALAFSNDGKYLASAGKDNVIIIWDFMLGKEIRRLKGFPNQINTLNFLNSEFLISGGNSNQIIIWNVATGKILRVINTKGQISSIAINNDNTLMASAGINSPLTIWSLNDTTYKNEIVNLGVNSNIDFSNNGEKLIYSINQRKEKGTYIYNINSKQIEKLNTERISNIKFAKNNNNYVFTSYKTSVIGLFNLEKHKIKYLRPSDYSRYKFCSIAISPNDSIFVCGNNDKSIYIFDVETGKRKQIIRHLNSSPNCIEFFPNRNDLLVFSVGKSIIVWSLTDNKIIRKIESSVFPISSVDINYNSKKIAFSGLDNNVKMFDISGGLNLNLITKHSANVTSVDFVNNSDSIISAGIDNMLFYSFPNNFALNSNGFKVNRNPMVLFDKVISAAIPFSIGGNLITMFYLGKSVFIQHHEVLNKVSISNDKKYIATGGGGWQGIFSTLVLTRNFPIKIFENNTQKNTLKLFGHYRPIKDIAFNHNNNYLASCAYGENYLKIWDLKSRKLKNIYYSNYYINSLAYNSVNDTLIFSNYSNKIYLFSPENDTAKFINNGKSPLFFNNTGKLIYFQDNNYNIIQFDLENKIIKNTFSGHNDIVSSASLNSIETRLVTSSWDGTIKLWEVETGNEIVTFIALNSSDFIVKTPDNYYFSTKKAREEIGFSTGEKFYPFEQFDLEYNRPDIILERIGNADTTLINAYRKAYYKRLKKMNFDESMFSPDFHLPEIRVENFKSNFSVLSKDYEFSVTAFDDKYKLDRVNVWLNNVPVFGTAGVNIRNLHSFSFKKEINLELIPGTNKIQVSCLNEKGVESLKETFEIKYETAEQKPDLYIVTIGTTKYKDTRYNLNYAAKDALDISDLFKNNTEIYKNVYIKTLTNEDVTKENIENIGSFIEKAGVNDVVMLFISGHGMLDEKFDYYFGTYDIDFSNPSARGIEYSKIEALLDGIKAIKKILIMDTCHSGEVEKDEIEIAQNIETEYGEVKFRAAGATIKNKSSFSMSNITDIMKELFNDLRTGTGSTVIASSSGVEYAMESDKWKNGLFSFCIINGLNSKKADLNNDNKIMLSELQDYVRKEVKKLSGGKQIPTSRIENEIMDYRIW